MLFLRSKIGPPWLLLGHIPRIADAWHGANRKRRKQHRMCGSTLEFAAKPAMIDVGKAGDQQAEARGG